METSAAERIANIGAGERRKRLAVGIGAMAAGVVLAVALAYVQAPLLWRLCATSVTRAARSLAACCS